MSNGDVTVTAPAGWSAPSTTPTERRLHDRVDRHRLGRRPDDHRQRRHPRRRRDADDRLRQHERRRPGRNGGDDRRGERLPDAAALDGRRRAREHRGLAVGERLRGRRLGDADDADDERRQRIDEHDRLHLQGRRGRRHLERLGHAHGAGRLARADRREHDVVARRTQLRRADRHRLGRDARSERHVHDHLRAGDRADDRRRADLVDDGALDGRRHAHVRSPPRRRSTSTQPTAPARSPAAPSTVGFGSAGNTQTFTYTAAAGGTSAGARDRRRAGRLERAEHHVRQRRLHGLAAPAPSRSPPRRSPSRR